MKTFKDYLALVEGVNEAAGGMNAYEGYAYIVAAVAAGAVEKAYGQAMGDTEYPFVHDINAQYGLVQLTLRHSNDRETELMCSSTDMFYRFFNTTVRKAIEPLGYSLDPSTKWSGFMDGQTPVSVYEVAYAGNINKKALPSVRDVVIHYLSNFKIKLISGSHYANIPSEMIRQMVGAK